MIIDHETIEQHYRSMGLETRRLTDEPGTVYEPHSHEEVRLFTIKGIVRVRFGEGSWLFAQPGQELVIENGQVHEARVGEEPWEYIIGASPEEMRRQGL